MLTLWQAMEKREAELAVQREREAAYRAQAAAELAEREHEVTEGVREWVEATQGFTLDEVIVTAQERLGRPSWLYRVSFRFPNQDGIVEGQFCARRDRLNFDTYHTKEDGYYQFAAGDVTDEDRDTWLFTPRLLDALIHAYRIGQPVAVDFPTRAEVQP
jgi:hypothetical protein